MADAQNRAAAREAPPEATPAESAPRPRRLSNRRGHAEPARPDASYKQIGGPIVGVLGVLILIALGARLLPSTSAPLADRVTPTVVTNNEQRTTNNEPTAAPATVDAYAAPDGARLGPIDASAPIKYRYGSTNWGGVKQGTAIVWVRIDPDRVAGLPDLAEPTPAPTPMIIIVEPECDVATNPRYSVALDVSAADGRPLGVVTGVSCDSQSAAQLDADQRAAELRQAAPPPCPTWHPPLKKPDCVK